MSGPRDVTIVGNSRWWQIPGDLGLQLANTLCSTVHAIKASQKSHMLDLMAYLRMYGGRRAITGMAFASAAIDNAAIGSIGAMGGGAQPNYNLIYSGVSTIVSRLVKNKPRCEIVTTGGDYALQDQAEKLQEFIDCLLYTSPSPRDRQKSRMPSSA